MREWRARGSTCRANETRLAVRLQAFEDSGSCRSLLHQLRTQNARLQIKTTNKQPPLMWGGIRTLNVWELNAFTGNDSFFRLEHGEKEELVELLISQIDAPGSMQESQREGCNESIWSPRIGWQDGALAKAHLTAVRTNY